MVTKVGDRGQVGIRGASVTDEWEQLVKFAAKRQGTTFADFIVDVTRTAALAIVKHHGTTLPPTLPDAAAAEPAVSSTLPVRIEDVAASLTEQMAKLAAEQDERLARIERQARLGRRRFYRLWF